MPDPRWVLGMHTGLKNDKEATDLISSIPALAGLGVKALVLEVNYKFAWKSHPEIAPDYALSAQMAGKVAKACKDAGIRVIPALNCLGHQSWRELTGELLRAHPDLDETPGEYPDNEGIYCRSWCPSEPRVNQIIFDLMDELIDAFQADAFHVGMDEVLIIGAKACNRCAGKTPAELFAKAVNDMHGHLVTTRHVEMFMWGDRLIAPGDTDDPYNERAAAANGTSGAVDHIPRDIVICDWRYGKSAAYPSIAYFLDKGFRVWPTSYNSVDAARALALYSLRYASNPAMQGHLFTHWSQSSNATLASWPALQAGIPLFRGP